MLKRLFALFLSCLMILSLLACSRNKEESVTETSTGEILSDEEALEKYISDLNSDENKEKELYYGIKLGDYIKLGEYKNLEFPSDPVIKSEASYEDAADYYEYVLFANFRDNEKIEDLASGVLRKFDEVTLDYEGYINSEKIDGACATDDTLVLGSKKFIDGFEDALIGKKIGEKIKIPLTFPKYYDEDELAGKDIVFEVTVKSAKRYTVPEITMEKFNETFGTSFTSKEEVIMQMKSDLTKDNIANRYDMVVNYLMKEIIAKSEIIDYPKKAIEHYEKCFSDYYEAYAQEYDTSNIGEDEYIQIKERYAKNAVENDLVNYAIAEKENIVIDDEAIKDQIVSQGTGNQYFTDLNSFIQYNTEINGLFYFKDVALTVAVADLIYDSAIEIDI